MRFLEMGRNLLNRKFGFFAFIVVLFWFKTYAVYRLEFHLGIDNDMQKFLLFVNPIPSALFFFGIALLFKNRGLLWAMIMIDFILSMLLYANVAYYRFFNDFITLPVLFQTNNFGDLGSSTKALMHGTDIFYFTDTIILVMLVLFRVVRPHLKFQKREVFSVVMIAFMCFIVNLGLAEGDRPQLLTRAFDRNYLVKYLGAYNFSIYDVIQSTRSSAQRAFASDNDLVDVENFVNANRTSPNAKYFGVAEGTNVIYVSMESFQNFMIGYKLDGQEVTPFLNSLVHDKHTFYFDNFFHQVGQGKTSDAEFMMANSLFPLPQGAVFTQKAHNTFQAAPAILKSLGYTSATFHGNYKTFWNRDQMYKSLGIEKFFDASYYDMTDENTINYGMKDKPFYRESMSYLKNLPQPFLAKFISLSNHFPFVLDPEDIDFPAGHFGDSIVNNYFQTAHYMDAALGQFFDELKAAGLYDHTVIVLYGDHYGLSRNHNAAMSLVMGEKITPYVNAQLQRVPLFIHVPGVKGKVVHRYGGEIDVRPTVLHLLGVSTKDYISFGSDLFSKEHRQIVPFRNGDFITPAYSDIGGQCYTNPDGKVVDSSLCKPYGEVARKELKLSDKVVYGDLLRFYHPGGFKPVDPSTINYATQQTDVIPPWRNNSVPGTGALDQMGGENQPNSGHSSGNGKKINKKERTQQKDKNDRQEQPQTNEGDSQN